MSIFEDSPLGRISVPAGADTLVIVTGPTTAPEALRRAKLGTLQLAHPELLLAALDFAATHPLVCDLAVGCYATGRAARLALQASTERPWGLYALVVMPESAELPDELLERVRVKTLLQVHADATEWSLAQRARSLIHEYVELRVARDPDDAALWGAAWLHRNLGAAQRERYAEPHPAP